MLTQELPQPLIDEFVGAAHGDFGRVKTLLEANPALLQANARWTETAIEAATQMGNLSIIEYLLDQGAALDIFTAAVLGRTQQVAAMLKANPALAKTPGVHGIPALYFPAIRGQLEIAALLLAQGADPNAGEGGTTPLHGAVMFGQAALVQWLLEHGAQPNPKNYEGKTPLKLAIDSGNEAIAALLKANGGIE